MNVVIRYRDGVIFNPDCIYADERPENYREKGRLVAKKGLDYYTLQEYLYSEDVRICYMQVDWKHEFCFLTQKAAENYLKRKGHNHSKDAHTYCICTYQDPEIARLMEIIETVDWAE